MPSIEIRKSKIKNRKTDTQPQLTRLHGLVQRIQRGDYPSANTLAREWEKSWRTIIRDLDFIRDVWRLPLEYHPSRKGFYFTEPIGKFPMVPISERELVSVFIAQKALQQYRGTSIEQPLRSAFSKLASSLQGDLSVAWADLDAAISFRAIESDPGNLDLLQKLGEAIRRRHEVQFEYCKLGELTGETRTVRPYHLANITNQWYLFAYDLLRKDIRRFVPTRMTGLKVLPAKFERPKNFSIEKLLKGSFSVFSGGDPVPVRLWFARSRAQLIRERKWHHSQKIKELGNGEIEVTMHLSSFAEIVPWILSWGNHCRALSPRALVKEVRAAVTSLSRLYRS